MNPLFDLYLPGDSWLHRLDPRAKLWALLLAGVTGLLFRQVGVLAGLLFLTHLLLLSARVPWDRLRWLWSRLGPLLAMILLLQPLLSAGSGPGGQGITPPLLHLGPIRLTVAGLLEGVSYALRVATLAFLVAALLLTTGLTALVQGLVRLGLPYPWGLTVGLALRYLPTMDSLFIAVREAQEARGWIVSQGGMLHRARAYIPVLVATIIAALRLSDRLGLALAARGLGYPARRTALHDLCFRPADWLAVALATLTFGGLMVVRYGLGFGARPW